MDIQNTYFVKLGRGETFWEEKIEKLTHRHNILCLYELNGELMPLRKTAFMAQLEKSLKMY